MELVYIIIGLGTGFIVSALIEARRRERHEANLRAWSDAMHADIEKAHKS